ncbi:hypothetical protein MKW92_029738 [Papaver armeniacum]|nr:hypothetical protein MKW92_029738 [Papaver armeniacum]
MDGFHGSLDPQAQEFIPKITSQFTLVQPHVYFPYPSSHHVPSTLYFTPPPPLHATPPPPPPPATQPPLMVLPPPPTTTFSATRSLLISLVPREVNEEVLRGELRVFGEIRGVEMQRQIQEGTVIVHFFDVRHAQSALAELQGKHIQLQSKLTQQHYQPNNTIINPFFIPSPSWVIESRSTSVVYRHVLPHYQRYQPGLIAGRTVWAEFTLPTMITSCLDGHNQGTIVLFNLVINVSTAQLKAIFQVFGPIKELRETPSKRQQRFIEFFDIRDAAKALYEMNGKEINGQTVVIEFSRPGGTRRRLASMNHSINSFYTRPTNYPQMQHELGKGFDSCIPMNNQRENSGGEGLDVSMSTLRVGGVDKNERNPSAASSSKKGKKIKDSGAGTTKQQASNNNKRLQPRSSTSRQWKGKQRTSDVKFLIHEDAVVESSSSFIKDARTTVMIKNIPNKYSQKLVLNMLDNHCICCNEKIFAEGDENQPLSAYDFVYLPIDFNNKCNVGYGFVNLTTPQAAWRLYKAFHLQQWEVFNSRKICEVTYARLQGLAELTEHFNNSKFACDKDDYLPVIFSPPRDGKQLTDPIAVGNAQANCASSDNVPLNHRLQTSPSGKSVMVNNLKGRDDKLEEDDQISGGIDSCTGSLIKNCNSNDDDDGRKKNIALMINKEDEVIVYDKKCNTSSNGTKSTTSYCGSSSLVSALPSSSAGKPNGCMSSSVSRQKPKVLSCAQVN